MDVYEVDGLYHAIEIEDWVTVREILRTKNFRRKIEHIGNSENENTLHLACKKIRTVPRDILESMVSVSPNLLLCQSSEGRTPLQNALSNIRLHGLAQPEESILDETIFILIDSCPQAATLADNLGETPLHFAIDLGLSSEFFKRLLTAGPSAINHRNNKGYTPLATFFQYWNIGIRRAFYSCIEKGGLLPNTPIRNFHNITDRQLHEVYDCLMQLIFAENEENYSKTPFNAARLALANAQCPWSIFHTILKAQPAIAFQHDEKGDYLLHLATTSISTLDGDLYECDMCETQLSLVNHWGIDPTYWLRYCRACDLELTGYRGNGIEDEDSDDESLIYLDSVDKIPNIAKDLIKINSEVANMPNHNGRLPLNLAIEQNSSLLDGHIKMMFEAAPDSLHTRDISNHMYTFMTAAVERTHNINRRGYMSPSEILMEKFELCYELLIQNPTLVVKSKTDG